MIAPEFYKMKASFIGITTQDCAVLFKTFPKDKNLENDTYYKNEPYAQSQHEKRNSDGLKLKAFE